MSNIDYKYYRNSSNRKSSNNVIISQGIFIDGIQNDLDKFDIVQHKKENILKEKFEGRNRNYKGARHPELISQDRLRSYFINCKKSRGKVKNYT